MTKITYAALLLVVLSGCDAPDSAQNPTQGDNRYRTQKICMEGVQYYQFHGAKRLAVAPAYNTDGTLQLCGRNQ